MTVLNMVETIREVFPNIGQSQIVHEANNALKAFALKVNGIPTLYELANVDTYIAWSLPDRVMSVDAVDAFDSDGGRLYLEDYNIIWKIVNDYIIFYDSQGDTLKNFPDNFYGVYLRTFAEPASITISSTSLGIDDKYDEAIESKILAKAYTLYPVEVMTQNGAAKTKDWNAVRYHNSIFLDGVKEYLKQKNSAGRTNYDILYHDYAGASYVAQPDGDAYSYSDAIVIPDSTGGLGLRWEELDTIWNTI